MERQGERAQDVAQPDFGGLRGGHDVPEETIRRRYRSGLRNFLRLYRRVATSWRFYENTEPTGPRLVATGEGTAEVITLPELWSVILESIK